MKLKKLKNILDVMSKEELDQDLIVIANAKTLSGYGKAQKSNNHLIYDGDDDPCKLKTKKELIDNGYEKDEISEMEVVVKKGQFFIELP